MLSVFARDPSPRGSRRSARPCHRARRHRPHTTCLPMPLGMAGVTAFFVLSGYIIRPSCSARTRNRPPKLLPSPRTPAVPRPAVGHGLRGRARARRASGRINGAWVSSGHSPTRQTCFGSAIGPLGSLEHVWSLAIEEQFYLVWPLAMLTLRGRWLLGIVAVAGAIAGTALYFATAGPGNLTHYYSTLTNGGALHGGLRSCGVAAAATGARRPARHRLDHSRRDDGLPAGRGRLARTLMVSTMTAALDTAGGAWAEGLRDLPVERGVLGPSALRPRRSS